MFSDNQPVIKAVQNLFKVIETPKTARSENAADEAMIKLMKAICKNLGIRFKDLPDSYYLRYFKVPSDSK